MADFDDYITDFLIMQNNVNELDLWKKSIEKSIDLKKEDYRNIEASLLKLSLFEDRLIALEKRIIRLVKIVEQIDADLYDKHFYDVLKPDLSTN